MQSNSFEGFDAAFERTLGSPRELETFERIVVVTQPDFNKRNRERRGGAFGSSGFELGQDARGTLQKNSDYLKRWGTTKVVVEGHADARGTNEYNLALGERRAAATRDYVVSLGIATERINIVSKGEEQPFCT